ncbi:hypothetical protein BABINDRAFT_169287 [Babjeviella inositovora NRRL Y-12698]|uniref:DNA replication regulator Sld3 C-terminal domain-containing protein n=1 Tax=Babjeviella inositovora NRRL Y-12698 TaxID=984486 RepID=A0A1E3QHI9_9ASCO|nr:uncharacterized protein BABINDRAFT_169287 [Babjeviella inositovora NRRL Y-12698]ODQ77159.1 hypothetical protein BABINDRAFT_169287 [Babjeviella inositovora NRRL Y-12698]
MSELFDTLRLDKAEFSRMRAMSALADDDLRTLLSGFSMLPDRPVGCPNSSPVKGFFSSPVKEQSAAAFLGSRYYQSLYLLTTPLTYFPKTTLTRLKVLCQGDLELETTLYLVLLTMEGFDRRHTGRLGLLEGPVASHRDHIESETVNREKLLERYAGILGVSEPPVGDTANEPTKEDKVYSLVLRLKVREAQLQILVLFEMFLLKNVDITVVKHQAAKKHQKIPVKSLVRSKSRMKRRLVPTLVNPESLEGPTDGFQALLSDGKIDYTDLLLRLDTFIDRLAVWDALLAQGPKSEDSAVGFVAYVINPYFGKKSLQLVNYMLDKIKGPSFKQRKKRPVLEEPVNLEPRMTRSASPLPLPVQLPLPLPSLEGEERSFRRVPAPPHLTTLTRSKSNLERPLLLKRASSTSFTSKNLEKRQVDLSMPLLNPEALEKKPQGVKQAKSGFMNESGGIFTKAASGTSLATQSFSQVEATPSSNRIRHVNLEEKVVFATPQVKTLRTQIDSAERTESEVIQSSPMHFAIDSSPLGKASRPEEGVSLGSRVKRRLFAPQN